MPAPVEAPPAEVVMTRAVTRIASPGHTSEDITTLAAAANGVHACTHAWWGADGPAVDPLGSDQGALVASRARILDIATVIIPGHGPAFVPGPGTPA